MIALLGLSDFKLRYEFLLALLFNNFKLLLGSRILLSIGSVHFFLLSLIMVVFDNNIFFLNPGMLLNEQVLFNCGMLLLDESMSIKSITVVRRCMEELLIALH
jgi:hypothetical protein